MAQATLNATVVLGGKVDNSFTRIGSILSSMGNTVNGVSRQLIDFGKQSIDVYRNYEDSMLDAQVALSTTYGRGTRELSAVMTQLDAQATEWAASSIFHTNDVGNAIAQAAHANWDLEKILEGIPAAMELAQAGGLDLSQAIDYIVKSTNAMGIEFKDVGSFIDEWVFAANSSAGSVETFGDAMVRMGKTMTFAQNRDELLSMIAVLHDAGATGSEAGTLLRNTMIRLVAPTDKAEEAMASLKLTQADVDEAMREVNGDTEAAMKTLQKMGFSAYDKNGNLKSFLEIFRDLSLVTEKMTEEERNDVLSALFPTRTITGALALLEEFRDGTSDLYQAIHRGQAENYGEFGAKTMMSGLTGAIETLASKWEKLQQVTGEALSGDVESFAEWAGGFIDKVSNMQEGPFNALVGGLKGVAIAGPGLSITGKSLELLGTALGTTTGRIALAAVAFSALTGAMTALGEVEYEEAFGNLELDIEPIKKHIEELTAPFDQGREDLELFKKAIEDALADYTDESSELSSGLLSKMIAGTELTGADKKKFEQLGESMYQSVYTGIQNQYLSVAQSLTTALTAEGGDLEDPMFQDILNTLNEGFASAISQAESLSQQLRDAMTSAFKDGVLSSDEVEDILAITRQYNELLAMETQRENYAQTQRDLRKAQSLGLESAEQAIDLMMSSRDDRIGTIEDERAATLYTYDRMLADGSISKEKYDEHISYFNGLYDKQIANLNALLNPGIFNTFDALFMGSDIEGLNTQLKDLSDALGTGVVSPTEAYASLTSSNGGEDIAHERRIMDYFIYALGGPDAIIGEIESNRAAGNDEYADELQNVLGRYAILNSDSAVLTDASAEAQFYFHESAENRAAPTASEVQSMSEEGIIDTEAWGKFFTALEDPDEPLYAGELWEGAAGLTEEMRRNIDYMTAIYGKQYDLEAVFQDSQIGQNGGAMGVQGYANRYAMWQLLNMSDEDAAKYVLGTDHAVGTTANTIPLTAPEQSPQQYPDWFLGWTDATAQSQQQTNPTPYTIGFDGTFNGDYTIPLTFNTDQAGTAKSQIDATVGAPVSVSVDFPNAGSAAAIAAAEVESAFPETMSVNVKVNATTSGMPSAAAVPSKGMAEGGRADEPVVFGEAGPEWFIPEGHTKRTAELLMQAAEASGYSWSDLASMSGAKMFADGGVIGHSEFSAFSDDAIPELDWGELTPVGYSDGGSGGESVSPVQVQYSPVINAENADGVDEVLQQDKDRLRQMLEELIEERDLIESVRAYR